MDGRETSRDPAAQAQRDDGADAVDEQGDADFTGPWNKGNGLKMVQGPAQPIAEGTAREVRKKLQKAVKETPSAKGNSKKSR